MTDTRTVDNRHTFTTPHSPKGDSKMNRTRMTAMTALLAGLTLGLLSTGAEAATLYFDADRDPSNGQTEWTKADETANSDVFVTGSGSTGSFWFDDDPDSNPNANQVDWSAGDFGVVKWTRNPNNDNVQFNVGTNVTTSGFEIIGTDTGGRRLTFANNGGNLTLTGDAVFRSSDPSFFISGGLELGGTPNSLTYEGGSEFNVNGSNQDHTFVAPVTVTGGSTVSLRDASGFGLETDANPVTLDDAVWEEGGNTGADGQFFWNPVKIGNGGATFVPNSNNALMRFTAPISDASTGDLTINGPGSLAFGGTDANTHSGNTIVTAGTLLLDKPDGTDAIAGDVLIQDGGVLALLENNQINDGSTVEVEAGGVLDLNYVGDVVIGPGPDGVFNKGNPDKDDVATGDQGTFSDFIAELILNSDIDAGTFGVVETGDGGILTTLAFSIDGVDQGFGTFTNSDLPDYIAGSGSVNVIPEPATMALMGLGGLMIVGGRRRA